MEATVREGQAPAAVVALQPGEKLTSEAGAMMFVTGDISMDVEMPGGLADEIREIAVVRVAARGPAQGRDTRSSDSARWRCPATTSTGTPQSPASPCGTYEAAGRVRDGRRY